MKSVQVFFLVVVFAIANIACGGSSDGGGDDNSDALFTIDGTVDEEEASIGILDVKITETGIIGLEILMSTLATGTADEDIETGEEQLKIKINDVSQITEEEEYVIGSGNDLVTYEDATDRFIATSGTITFTQIGNQVGDAVEVTFSAGFVNTDVNNPRLAQLSGTLSESVESD